MSVLERVTQEANELRSRLDRLREFIFTPAYKELTDNHQMLLAKQSAAMNEYLTILNLRIADLS